ncbi:TolC family protein [Desulfobacter postgatei]|uniref:TolC family protein n=1 Tax=Desulfobacter postgatei TaxID=2293 RepID=UPI00259BBE4E|nr:TolC family protein [uncultured Desulfobacter sp.]
MKILPLLLIVGLFGGCASMRPTDPYASVNIRGGDSTGVDVELQTPRIPKDPLTLQQAIETALANNPEIAARGWDAAAAQAGRDQALGARLPRVGIVGGYTHTLDEQRLIPASRDGESGLFSRDIVSGDLVVSMPLFTGGRLVNQVNAADLLRKAAEQRLARSREELVFNVSSVFNSILAQEHVIESLEFSRKTLTEHVNRIDALITAQKAARVDRMRTEVRLADIEQQLVREKNLQSIQYRALANLLGLRASEKQLPLQGELEMQENIVLPKLETALSVAREDRADYLAARSSLEAQAKNVDVAKSGHLPTLSVQGSYGRRWATGPTTGAGDEQGDVGRIGMALEVPIFEGGQVDADIREKRAALAAAQERLRLLDLQVRLEVEAALLNVESSGERAVAIRKSIAQAKESLRIEQQKYNLGKGAIVDVLDAQAALLESETTYYLVLAEYHTAVAQLKLAMGAE